MEEEILLFFSIGPYGRINGYYGRHWLIYHISSTRNIFGDFKTAIVLVAIFHLFGNIGRIIFFRQGFDKRIILQFGVPSVLPSLLGAFLRGIIAQPALKLTLGIFLIIISVAFSAKPGLEFPQNTDTFIVGGSVTGFITALVGTGVL